MSDREWFWSKVIMAVLLTAALGTLIVVTLGEGFSEEPTCPNYGEVPALIDGGYECIPWEVQP